MIKPEFENIGKNGVVCINYFNISPASIFTNDVFHERNITKIFQPHRVSVGKNGFTNTCQKRSIVAGLFRGYHYDQSVY